MIITITSSVALVASRSTSTALSVRRLVSPPRTITASRLKRPRSSTGGTAPTAAISPRARTELARTERVERHARHDRGQDGGRAQVPGIGSQTHRGWRHGEPALVAESTEPEDAPPELPVVRSHGRGVHLRRGVQDTRPGCPEDGHRGGDDDVTGLVAGRLRPLWAAVHSDGVAQRGHVPHPRWPRRRRLRHATLRSPQQLARQREPRQGAPVALADQAEVRPEDLVGRPDDPRGQLCPGVDGAQDVRFRRRARGRLGA